MLDTNMDSKIILVTGATSGIGEAITKQLVMAGAKIVAVARNKERLEKLHQENPDHIFPFSYDLMDLENMEDIFRYCKENSLKLDGLVHCAGVTFTSVIKTNNIEEMEQAMRINCFALFELGKYFSMKKYSNDGSSLVAISSIASVLNSKGQSQYSASKAAVNSVVKTMSKEFMRRKIRVNAILPACVKTTMLMVGVQEIENYLESAQTWQPLGIIEAEQIAYLAEFLLSDNAKFMTGELVVVSGGIEY
ncbi:MAG: SDR family oxidoreductase [Lachnospiraceae bacterium]|nr:SDR family oxidoreductase [Lachnospiraceae bacterium]